MTLVEKIATILCEFDKVPPEGVCYVGMKKMTCLEARVGVSQKIIDCIQNEASNSR